MGNAENYLNDIAHRLKKGGVEAVAFGGNFTARDRDKDKTIFSGSLEFCAKVASDYIKENPDATVCLYELKDRIWKCKSTGNIRTNHHKSIE